MTLIEQLKSKRGEIVATAARHGAFRVRVFGSAATGKDRPDSDIDILVDASENTSSWFPAGLVTDLQQLLGRPVDVVTSAGVNPLLKDQVFKEAVEL